MIRSEAWFNFPKDSIAIRFPIEAETEVLLSLICCSLNNLIAVDSVLRFCLFVYSVLLLLNRLNNFESRSDFVYSRM